MIIWESRKVHFLLLTAISASLITALASGVATAQNGPVSVPNAPAPQLEVAGQGVATAAGQWPRSMLAGGAHTSTSRIDLSDSSLLLRASQKLFRADGVGSLTIGGTTIEDVNGGGSSLFLHQMFLDYQTHPLEVAIGRTDAPTHLMDFPTLRGDDLYEFVNVVNAYSSGKIPEEHRYANSAAVSLNSGLRNFVTLHADHMLNSSADSAADTGINAYGVTFQYAGPTELEALQRVPMWGAGFTRQTLDSGRGGAANVLFAGGVFNLNPDPIDRVDLRVQDIFSTGNSLAAITTAADAYRAASNTVAASLRWLHSPFGRPAHQIALTVGYRTYQKVTDASTVALALTGTKRIGNDFDAIVQYSYQSRSGAYAMALNAPAQEHLVQVGLVFNFNSLFNQHIGPRRSLTNLQHKYIPD